MNLEGLVVPLLFFTSGLLLGGGTMFVLGVRIGFSKGLERAKFFRRYYDRAQNL